MTNHDLFWELSFSVVDDAENSADAIEKAISDIKTLYTKMDKVGETDIHFEIPIRVEIARKRVQNALKELEDMGW